ncbi:MAG: hypothetical protein ABIG96_01840 [Candidatus Micrarchaeota archaeon]
MSKLLIAFLIALLLPPAMAADSFTVNVDIAEGYRQVGVGETVWSTATIFNLGEEKRIDITVRYDVLDSQKNSISTKTKTIAIETQVSTSEGIKLPDNIVPGKYTLKVTVGSEGKAYAGEHSFQVVAKSGNAQAEGVLQMLGYAGIAIILVAGPFLLMPRFQKYNERRSLRNKIRKIVRGRIKR